MAASKFRQTDRKLIIQGLREGITVTVCCKLAGIAPVTYYSWINKGEADINRGVKSGYADFARETKKAVARGEQTLVRVIRKASRKTWTAAAWLLTHSPTYKARYSKLHLTSEKVAQMTDAEILTMLKKHYGMSHETDSA